MSGCVDRRKEEGLGGGREVSRIFPASMGRLAYLYGIVGFDVLLRSWSWRGIIQTLHPPHLNAMAFPLDGNLGRTFTSSRLPSSDED